MKAAATRRRYADGPRCNGGRLRPVRRVSRKDANDKSSARRQRWEAARARRGGTGAKMTIRALWPAPAVI
jgi:hypothetical protein